MGSDRGPLPLVASALVLLAPGGAAAIDPPTIYDNAQMYPLGGRAAGMAGAYTALGCDEAAIHYNPGALGCAGDSRLELAANVYTLQAYDLPNAFGEGQDIDAITYHSLPSIAGFVRVLDHGDPDTGVGRWVAGLSVEVPRSLSLRADPARPEVPNFVTLSVRDALTTADVGFGYQIDRRVGVGATVGAAMRNAETLSSVLLNARDPTSCGPPALAGACREFIYLVSQRRMFAVGARAKVGARFAPTERWSVGVAIESPSIDIYGSSSLVETLAFGIALAPGDPAIFGGVPSRFEGASNLSLPMRAALGTAYRFDRVALSLDLSLAFPRTVKASHELEAVPIQNMATPTAEEIDAQEILYQPTWQPNARAGAEVLVFDDVAIALGAFTDLSSVSSADVEMRVADRVHMFGGTAALGILGRQARAWFGLSFEYGVADANVYDGALDLDGVLAQGAAGFAATSTAPLSRWTLAGILGSSYHFGRGP
jgi:long-chain fatty acid transport protein